MLFYLLLLKYILFIIIELHNQNIGYFDLPSHSRCVIDVWYILRNLWYSSNKINVTNTHTEHGRRSRPRRGEGRFIPCRKRSICAARARRCSRIALYRILPFRTPIPFLPRRCWYAWSVDIPPCACLSLKKILSARNATTYFGAGGGESCDISLSRSDLYYHGTSTLLRSGGVITLDFKWLESISGD